MMCSLTEDFNLKKHFIQTWKCSHLSSFLHPWNDPSNMTCKQATHMTDALYLIYVCDQSWRGRFEYADWRAMADIIFLSFLDIHFNLCGLSTLRTTWGLFCVCVCVRINLTLIFSWALYQNIIFTSSTNAESLSASLCALSVSGCQLSVSLSLSLHRYLTQHFLYKYIHFFTLSIRST